MARAPALLAGALVLAIAPALHAQEPPPPQQAASVREVRIIGAEELPEAGTRAAMKIAIGEPLLDSPERVAETAERRYHAAGYTTLGTLADQEVDAVGDAVFGRTSETNSLGSLGRLVFRTVLQVSDYLQSVTAEVKSRRLSGQDVLRAAP